MERIIVYIDGFNLYFGMKSKGWRRYYWLNLQKLALNLLKEGQELVTTKYFTSRISSPPDQTKRQATYIEALETLNNFHIYYGHYMTNTVECKKCGAIIPKPNEKMTDVNIAVEMLTDAFADKLDRAIFISADSDLAEVIRKMRKLFPDKKVVAAFPPERSSFTLTKIAYAAFTIGRKKLAESQFPDEVTKQDGFVLHRPALWR